MSPTWSVSDLNRYVRQTLLSDYRLQGVRVSGEISGFRAYPSGHWYFTLKDAAAQVSCVMWRGRAEKQQARFLPRDGDAVEVQGDVNLYEARGQYQLGVAWLERAGEGRLYQEFVRLKAKLEAEGLFDRWSNLRSRHRFGRDGHLVGALFEHVHGLQDRALRHDMHILVVYDNSRDGTADAVRAEATSWPNLHLITGVKAGLGAAYIRGMKHAIGALKADAVMEMDADFSHKPEDAPRLIAALDEGADFVIGSRYVPGGKIPYDWSFFRRMNSKWGNVFARYVAGMYKVRDCTAGFRAIRASVISEIDLDELRRAITDRTILISIMAANNEVGAIQPVAELGVICRKHGILFHTDAVQWFGKMPFHSLDQFNADLVSLCAHKIQGPKGAGLLFARSPLHPDPTEIFRRFHKPWGRAAPCR